MNRRVVINREALTALGLGIADGLTAWAEGTLDDIKPHVPDQPPTGKGLVETDAYAVYVNAHKVAGKASKPRKEIIPRKGITVILGYDFPARFNELGTIHQPARPFFTPRVNAASGKVGEVIGPKAQARIGR